MEAQTTSKQKAIEQYKRWEVVLAGERISTLVEGMAENKRGKKLFHKRNLWSNYKRYNCQYSLSVE